LFENSIIFCQKTKKSLSLLHILIGDKLIILLFCYAITFDRNRTIFQINIQIFFSSLEQDMLNLTCSNICNGISEFSMLIYQLDFIYIGWIYSLFHPIILFILSLFVFQLLMSLSMGCASFYLFIKKYFLMVRFIFLYLNHYFMFDVNVSCFGIIRNDFFFIFLV